MDKIEKKPEAEAFDDDVIDLGVASVETKGVQKREEDADFTQSLIPDALLAD